MKNILFCGSKNVFDGILTATLSILKRSKPTTLNIFIFTMDMTEMNKKFEPINDKQSACLEKLVKEYDENSQVHLIDVKDIYTRELGGCPNEKAYCSPYTLIRLLADLVDGIPDKLLYLDCDILFNRDIALLYDKNIEKYEYAGAPDHYGKYVFLHHPGYLNAGVLLFNMKKCRETGLFVKARNHLKRKKFLFADQTAIVKSTKKRKHLPQKFNDQKFLHKHTVIRHFAKRLFWFPYPHTANIKQWDIESMHKIYKYHQWDDVLDEYLKRKEEY